MTDTENVKIFEKVKQKRGRKPKMVILPNKNIQSEILNNIMINIEENKEIKIEESKIEESKIEEPKTC